MDNLPLWAQILALVVLLAISSFFSISETSLMALNRYRLRHLVATGKRSAARVSEMLKQTDKLLGTILLGNNLVNAALTALVTSVAITTFGNDETVLALATSLAAFLIIVFAEITPKVIGATWPEKIALPTSGILGLLMRVLAPLVSFVNFFVNILLKPLRLDRHDGEATRLSPEELRSLVLESGQYIQAKHRTILVNLFELERITVDDVMTPRGKIEAIDLVGDPESLRRQITTCFHNKLPVFERDINNVIGILHVRKAVALLSSPESEVGSALDKTALREVLSDPYFVPSGTDVFTQLQNFQETRQKLGLVVDEYGDLLGLVTLEDIVEEIVGEFTTNTPGGSGDSLRWDENGEILVEGGTLLRELNRRLGLNFPLDGPKTLNGLVLEQLQDLPDGGVGLKVSDIPIEIVQVQDRAVRIARLTRPLQQPSV